MKTAVTRPSCVTIQCRDGHILTRECVEVVEWSACGWLAVHEAVESDDVAPLAITHRPTGLRIAFADSMEEARRIMEAVAGYDWSFRSDSHFFEPGNIEARERLKRAIQAAKDAEVAT